MLTQETLAEYFENQLDAAERTQVEQQLADDREAQKQLLDQQSLDLALQVILGNGAAHERVKNSIFAVLQALPDDELRAGILRAARAELKTATPTLLQRLRRVVTLLSELADVRAGLLGLFSGWQGRLALGAAAVFIALALIVFFSYATRPFAQVTVGKFAVVMGRPRVRHADQRSTLSALRSSAIQLGDRIETGDADKAEIQFNDGTTLHLNFNTILEIPQVALQQANARLARPTQVKLLEGQVWAKVQKLTNAPQFAVQTPVATAAVKGTEFGLKLHQAKATRPANANSTSASTLLAILTVREGAVEFSNAFGKVEATALTESQATADTAPTAPQRVAALKTFRLNRTHLSVRNRRLHLDLEPEWLVYPVGWIGITVVNTSPDEGTGASPPTNSAPAFRISGVRPGSPATLAGLHAGDVLTAVNGQAVTNAWQVRAAAIFGLNQPVTLSFRRANEQLTVSLIPMRSPDAPPLPAIPAQIQNTLFLATAQLIEAVHERQIAPGRVTPGEFVLEQLLQTHPDAAVVHHNLGVLHEGKDELGEAIRHYQRAVELDPQVPLYHFHLGTALRGIGNLERSAEELEQAALLAPAWPLPVFWLADGYSLLQRHEDAVNALDLSLQINPRDPTLWQQKAEVLLRARQPQAALPAALKAVELDPALALSHITLGLVYHDLGRKDEAEAAQRKAIELGSPNASPYVNLAHLVRARGRLADAEALYRKALDLEPDEAAALQGLGGVFFDRSQMAEAEKWYRKAVELDPNSSTFFSDLGNTVRLLGQLDQAEQYLRKAIELEPENAEAHANLGILYSQRRQWPDAEQSMLKAAELDPNLPIENDLAFVYQNQGKLDQQEQVLRRSLARNTNNPVACNDLAWQLAERAIKLDEALELAQRAVDLATNQPYLPNLLDTLGWVHYQRGELDQAEQTFQRAIDIAGAAPSANSAREHLRKAQQKKAGGTP